MDGVLLGAGIILNFWICFLFLKETDGVKCSVLSVFLYFCCYVIVGGILFGLDVFSIKRALILIALAEAAFLLPGWKKKRGLKLEWPVRRYLFPIVLTLFMLPVVWNKFGFYGMGQDEGVYQTQAVAFMNRHYENQKDFQEYELLDEEGKKEFCQFVDSQLVGYYIYDETLPSLPEEGKRSDVSGFYHGIPVFSAMLALWGNLFGMGHMAGIQTVFYICSLFLLFFTCGNLRLREPVKYAIGILYAVSPIILWVSKSSLTEMFLSCIIVGFLYFMTGDGNGIETGYAALTVTAFSFYHLTIYTILPVIILIFWGMFIYSKKKGYIYASAAVLLAFMVSMINVSRIAATYSFVYNFSPLYQFTRLIRRETVLPFLLGGSALGLLFSFLLLAAGGKNLLHFPEKEWIGKICVRLGLIVFVALQLRIAGRLAGDGYETLQEAVQHLSITGFVMYGGGILMILAGAYIFWKPSLCWQNARTMIIIGMSAYCILFYCCFLRKDIFYHYYYGRYLAPFICIAALTIGIAVNDWKTAPGKAAVWIMTAVYVAVCMPYDFVLAKNDDDTRMEWKILEETAAVIPEDAVVYMNPDMGMISYLPLRELIDMPIFPARSQELSKKAKEKKGEGEDRDIYFISEMNQYLPMCKMVYANWYGTSENENEYNGKLLPLPLKMSKDNRNIAVYKVQQEQYEYKMADRDVMISGYYGLESDFRWGDPQENRIQCVLDKKSYTVRVVQGTVLPFDALGKEEYEVKLQINGQYASSYTITKECLEGDLLFALPEELTEEGENEISFLCESWSPQDFGVPDSRKLGIAVKQVIFE